MAQRKIKVTGVRRKRLDEDKLAEALWLMGKAAVEAKRTRQADEKKARRAERGRR